METAPSFATRREVFLREKRQLGHHWVTREMLRLPLTTQFISISFHLLYEF